MHRITFRVAAPVGLAVACLIFTELRAWAVAPRPSPPRSGEEFSPLFERRLEVGIQQMDSQEEVYAPELAGMLYETGPMEFIVSANPVSLCLASGCFGSACLGSACLRSQCLGSACTASGCGGSACIGSGCVGSACIGSGCAGSVCVGTGCLGSACLQCGGSEPAEDSEPLG